MSACEQCADTGWPAEGSQLKERARDAPQPKQTSVSSLLAARSIQSTLASCEHRLALWARKNAHSDLSRHLNNKEAAADRAIQRKSMRASLSGRAGARW